MTVLDVVQIVSAVAGLVSVGVVVYKTRGEKRKLDSESADTFASAAEKYAKQVTALQDRVGKLENKIDEQEQELDKLRRERDQLKDWVERLVHQVRSLGSEPVKMRMYEDES